MRDRCGVKGQYAVKHGAARGHINVVQRIGHGVLALYPHLQRGKCGKGAGERLALVQIVAAFMRPYRGAKRSDDLLKAHRHQFAGGGATDAGIEIDAAVDLVGVALGEHGGNFQL